MNGYYGYTRVSTVKQGNGVSLEAQQEAIHAYAAKFGMTVTAWFEEKETAAKQGRPVFSQMMKSLKNGEAKGLIVHKIDRSTRNSSDWAKIGELIDSGVDVRFAHENLDMNSRGGRLTADIQAVIAADYVRNLREECLKGIEGRLKQGLFPFRAPIGYLDQGKGKPKILDPERAPFTRQAFELYATQQYSLRSLLTELNRRGFRNSQGKPISQGCLENLLSNPFYHGVIYMKRSNRTFQGAHEPLITKRLFDCVQHLKSNKQIKKNTVHNHLFRRLLTCGRCTRSLYGELQKGHVYMRCQTKGCPTKTIRQEVVEAEIGQALLAVQLTESDHRRLTEAMTRWLKERTQNSDKQAIELQLAKLNDREDQLTDALLDRLIDKETFQGRKNRLIEERAELEAIRSEYGRINTDSCLVQNFLELTKSLYLTYQMANGHMKRRLAEIIFSNLTLTGKSLCLTPQNWLKEKEVTLHALLGAPDRDGTRTKLKLKSIIEELQTIADASKVDAKP